MTSTNVKYIAIGQGPYHVDQVTLTTEHPRKELMEVLGATHAQKIYTDTSKEEGILIGYIIKGQWWTLYAVEGKGPRKEIDEHLKGGYK